MACLRLWQCLRNTCFKTTNPHIKHSTPPLLATHTSFLKIFKPPPLNPLLMYQFSSNLSIIASGGNSAQCKRHQGWNSWFWGPIDNFCLVFTSFCLLGSLMNPKQVKMHIAILASLICSICLHKPTIIPDLSCFSYNRCRILEKGFFHFYTLKIIVLLFL